MKLNRFAAWILSLLLLTPCVTQVSAAELLFPDVSKDHWAAEYIYECVDYDIIDGYPDGTYRPEDTILTGEFIKMVVCAYSGGYRRSAESLSMPEGSHWAKRYLTVGDEYFFLASDYEKDESLDREITRVEVADMIVCMYMQRNYYDNTKNHTDTTGEWLKDITDVNLLDDYQKEMVNTVLMYGFMTKFDDGTFRPNDTLTRAEAAKIIYLAVEN